MAGWSVLQTHCTKSGFKDCFNDSMVGISYQQNQSFHGTTVSQKKKGGIFLKHFKYNCPAMYYIYPSTINEHQV